MDEPLTVEEITVIVSSSHYQSIRNRLLDFLKRSRYKLDPTELLNLEIEIANEIIKLEKQITLLRKLANRPTKNNAWFTREVFKAERRALKQIADGIAWRYLGFSRSVMRKLSDHHDTGFLSPGFVKEVEVAKKITLTKTGYVLLNDITNYLRHGDLTVIMPGEVSFAEIKSSKVNSGRGNRQKNRLDELLAQLNQNKFAIDKGSPAEVLKVPGKVYNFLTSVEEAIKRAAKSEQGFFTVKLAPYLWVSVVNSSKLIEWKNKTGKTPILPKPPFEKSRYIAPISSITLFDSFSPNVAPFTIFPFDEEAIIDIILARLWVFAHVGEKELIKSFRGKGWELQLPTEDIWNEIIKTAGADRKEAINNSKYFPKFKKQEYENNTPWTTLLRIHSEFLSVKSIVNTLEYAKNQMLPGRHRNYYADFELEAEQWL